jgi:hypothetical protein
MRVSEDSYVKFSYSTLAFIISLFIGAVTWLTTAQLTLASNTKAIESIQSDNEKLKEVVIRIDKNLAEINAMIRSHK